MKTPSQRQIARRRGLMLVCAFVALAIVSGLIGSLTDPDETPASAARLAAAFNYFPSQ